MTCAYAELIPDMAGLFRKWGGRVPDGSNCQGSDDPTIFRAFCYLVLRTPLRGDFEVSCELRRDNREAAHVEARVRSMTHTGAWLQSLPTNDKLFEVKK
jgi:hypothetical protein